MLVFLMPAEVRRNLILLFLFSSEILSLLRLPPNSVRYWRWGGRGLCLGAEQPEVRKVFENEARHEAAVPSLQCITLALGQCQDYPSNRVGRGVRWQPLFQTMHIGFLSDETTKEAAKPILFLRRIRAVLTGDYFIQNIKINIIQFIDVET